MYNHHLTAFIKAAELKSFSKAAKELYITPTSLIQQINLLESHLGVTLFYRSKRGVSLTAAGQAIYEDAKNIIHLSNIAVTRARSLDTKKERTVRIGTSLFTKCKYLPDIWSHAIQKYPDIKIELIAQKSLDTMTSNPMIDMGTLYDMTEGVYLPGLYDGKCNFHELLKTDICIAIPPTHKLASKNTLNIKDLSGEKIVFSKKGDSPVFDAFRQYLIDNGTNINIVDVDYYDINVFATCELNHYLLVSLDVWSDIYPSMKTCKLDVTYSLPYGLLFGFNVNSNVNKLIDTAKMVFK